MSNKSKPTPAPWIADKTTIFAVNTRGVNRFSADIQPGTLDNRNLTTLPEREANAELICAAVNSYAKLPDPLEAAKEDLLGKLIVALKSVTDEKADWLAHEMDHRNKDHSKWWKAVEAARAFLATQERKP